MTAHVYVSLTFLFVFLLVIYVASVIKAVRDRREMKKRLEERDVAANSSREKAGGSGGHSSGSTGNRRFNVVITHDGVREERLKRGYTPGKSVLITRDNLDSLYLSRPDEVPSSSHPSAIYPPSGSKTPPGDGESPAPRTPGTFPVSICSAPRHDLPSPAPVLPHTPSSPKDASNNASRGLLDILPVALRPRTTTFRAEDLNHRNITVVWEMVPVTAAAPPPQTTTLNAADFQGLSQAVFDQGILRNGSTFTSQRILQIEELNDLSDDALNDALEALAIKARTKKLFRRADRLEKLTDKVFKEELPVMTSLALQNPHLLNDARCNGFKDANWEVMSVSSSDLPSSLENSCCGVRSSFSDGEGSSLGEATSVLSDPVQLTAPATLGASFLSNARLESLDNSDMYSPTPEVQC